MALQNRKAFTLVELLVVIVIIGMLMALLLPAVLGARARARRVQCTNRQQELGKALLQYETTKGHLPGYVNRLGVNGEDDDGDTLIDEPDEIIAASWVVMVFQYLGEGDLWKKWRDGKVSPADKVDPTHNDFAAVTLPGLICPTDDPTEIAPLSYVVNCGLSDNTADIATLATVWSPADPVKAANAVQDPAYGLFFDHTVSASARTRVMLDKITDGAQHTIMLSENIQASQWVTTDPVTSLPRPLQQLDVGIVWWSEVDPPFSAVVASDGRMINRELNKELKYQADYTGTPNSGRYFARPSSAHPGGVVVTFADGHSAFQDEDMDYGVYQSLMTPEVSKARKQGLVGP